MKLCALPIALLCLICLTACADNSNKTVYTFTDSREAAKIRTGFIGCVWRPHKLKTHTPLKGKLRLNILDCSLGEEYRSVYGDRKEYYLNSENKLFPEKTQADIDRAEHESNSFYLKLHEFNGSVDLFMQKFVNKAYNSNCTIRENSNGVWQVGFEKSYLESQGYSFPYYNEVCPRDLPTDYNHQNIYCLTEHDFPFANYSHHTGYPESCSIRKYSNSGNVFRVSGSIILEYHPALTDNERNNQSRLDLNSIEFSR